MVGICTFVQGVKIGKIVVQLIIDILQAVVYKHNVYYLKCNSLYIDWEMLLSILAGQSELCCIIPKEIRVYLFVFGDGSQKIQTFKTARTSAS